MYDVIEKALQDVQDALENKSLPEREVPRYLPNGEEVKTVAEVAALMGLHEHIAARYILEDDGMAPGIRSEAKRLTKPPNFETGIMIALDLKPEDRKKIALRGGTPSSDLHITLGYYGDIEADDAPKRTTLLGMIGDLAVDFPPFVVDLNGITRFTGEEQDPLVVNADSPQIEKMRSYLQEIHPSHSEHGYTPHMTIGWLDPEDEDIPVTRWESLKVEVDTVSLHYGNKISRFTLTGEEFAPAEAKMLTEFKSAFIEEKSLVDHAESELRKAGLFDTDSDYDGKLAESVMDIVRKFSEQGHSGSSAYMTIDLVQKLLSFKPLTPLTSDPDEWMHISETMAGQPDLWQSRRDPEAFSNDAGRSYYLLSTGIKRKYRSKAPRRPSKDVYGGSAGSDTGYASQPGIRPRRATRAPIVQRPYRFDPNCGSEECERIRKLLKRKAEDDHDS